MTFDAPYTPPGSDHVFQVPTYLDDSDGNANFKTFADSMPDLGPLQFHAVSGDYEISNTDRDHILKIISPTPSVLFVPNDDTIPVGSQVAIFNNRTWSLRIEPRPGVQVQDASSLLVKGYKFAMLIKSKPNLWLLSLGIGGDPVPYNEASGGTPSEYLDGDGRRWKVHTFTDPNDTLTVIDNVAPFRVLVAGGGGGVRYYGSSNTTGGGGAGGLFMSDSYVLDAKAYPVVVGAGGGGGYQGASNGAPSVFDTVTMIGGGFGTDIGGAGSGASGGGGGGNNDADGAGGSGTPGQGFGGGSGKYGGPGGGGGAGGAGDTGTDRYDPQGCQKGIGGPGLASNIRGTNEVFCAGGRAAVGSVFGGGAFGGCGGAYGNGQQGVVIISYEVQA